MAVRFPLVHIAEHVGPQSTGSQRTGAQRWIPQPITRVELK